MTCQHVKPGPGTQNPRTVRTLPLTRAAAGVASQPQQAGAFVDNFYVPGVSDGAGGSIAKSPKKAKAEKPTPQAVLALEAEGECFVLPVCMPPPFLSCLLLGEPCPRVPVSPILPCEHFSGRIGERCCFVSVFSVGNGRNVAYMRRCLHSVHILCLRVRS